MPPAFHQRLLQLAVPARVGGILIAGALLLPWCGDVRGHQLLGVRNLEEMWLFPLAAALLILLPLILRHGNRAAVTLLLGAAVAAGAAWAAWRLGKLRGPGVWLTLAGGLVAMLGGLAGPWRENETTIPEEES